MRFSQRIGKRPVKTLLQVESIDSDLLNRLWNTVLEDFFDKVDGYSSYGQESRKGEICKLFWKEFYNYPIDQIPISIYGYTSNSGGIRHGLLESDIRVGFEDAKFMLVYCSAFINYLKTKMKM